MDCIICNWNRGLASVLCFMGYSWYVNKSQSPFEVVTHQQSNISIQIEYCRPYKKGRLIFGPAEENALLPYGRYWRLGANQATKLILQTDIEIGGQLLAAGSYSLYAFPNASHWVIGINKDHQRSGSSSPDFSKDVGRIKVPVEHNPTVVEQFTISFEEVNSEVLVVMAWDKTLAKIPVRSGD